MRISRSEFRSKTLRAAVIERGSKDFALSRAADPVDASTSDKGSVKQAESCSERK
jgi:hypothetical protein